MPYPSLQNISVSPDNDGTCRKSLWRRYEGDPWAAFDALPAPIRHRLAEHVYDAWSVNALILWRHYKKLYGATPRAERAMIRYLDYCERLEQKAFTDRHGALAHLDAGATPLRYGALPTPPQPSDARPSDARPSGL